MSRLQTVCKRLLDIAGSLLGLVVLWPVVAMVAVIIRLTMGGPILFRQVRPGLNERPFTLYKFRTMVESESSEVDPSTDAARLTRTGMMLRRFRLDELPQLWNVLMGEISLVGPRPLLMEYLNHYTAEQAKRHLMKLGMTGLAQMKGRNAITWEEKFAWDVWHVNHWNFWLDLRILLSTVVYVVRRGAIIYTAAIVEHDCRIGDFAHLSPKAAIGGHVKVGELSWLGIGSAVIPNIRISAYSIIGAGATVVRDVDDWVVAAGTPAHTLRELARRI